MPFSSPVPIQNLFIPFKHPPLSTPSFLNSPNFFKSFLLSLAFLAIFSLTFPLTRWRFYWPDQALIRHLSPHDQTNISHIFFGIGGSAATWAQRRRYSEIWWAPNATRGFIWLDENPSPANGLDPWPDSSIPYRVSADTARFKYTCPYGMRSAVRMARIVKESFELGPANVRWFVMGDDDTIFFPENLVTVLSKYDHEKMYYIGSISESVHQDVVFSYTMAYGGAGFAISRPLAAELARVLDGCIDRYSNLFGSDQKIGGCMSEIGVPLTKEIGFHQMDIRGSPYGLLSAHPLAPLVSLHHLDYIDPLFPNMTRPESIQKLFMAHRSDPARTLQHAFCYDMTRNWSISISWGYTVQLYPFFVTARNLSIPLRTFLTWTRNDGPFAFDTRAMETGPCGRPVVFYFDRVEKPEDGSTLSWYYRNEDHGRKCEWEQYKAAYLIKGFNVSGELLHPQVWSQWEAPRRQCCDVLPVGGSDLQDDVVQVKIRGCNHWETVTPP